MSRVTIQLPRVLAELVACETRVDVQGETVEEALQDLVALFPAFRFHLFSDTGDLRRHVLCFRNGVSTKTRAELGQTLSDGDELALVNSVAGG